MKLPRHIFNVLNFKHGFDNLFLVKLKDSNTATEAYNKSVNYVQEFIPEFKPPYGGYDSYKSKKRLEALDEIDIPDDVINAAVNGIENLFHQRLHRYKTNVLAFEQTMIYINRYLPNYKPYSSYQAFRNSLNRKRKRVIKQKRKKI